MAVSQSVKLVQGAQSVEDNTTKVTFTWTSTQTGASYNAYSHTAYYWVSINDGAEEKYAVSYVLPKATAQTIVSKTFTVKHKDDGTGKISIRTWMDTSISAGVVEKSASLTLTTIPRASSISSLTSSVSINGSNEVTVNINRHSSSFTHKVRFYINDTYTKTFSDVGTSKSYAIPTSWLNAMPSSDNTTAKCVVTTYKGDTKIGDAVTKSFKVTVPSGVVPSIGDITLNPKNITTVDGTSRNILVQDKNTISFSVSGCKAGTGSSIKNYKFDVLSGSTVIATTTTTGESATFGPFSKTGTLKFRLTVTDKRGRSVSNKDDEPTWTCYAYEPPSFSSFTACRCNSSGTADENGTYVKYSFKVNYASVNSTNKSTVKIFYKQGANSSWTAGSNALTDSTTKSATAIIKNSSGTTQTFSISSTYSVYATIIDNYNGSVDSSTITIFSAERIFNIRKNGRGMAFGKLAESDNLLESKWPLRVDDKITFGNGIQGSLYTDQNSDGVNIAYLLTGQDTSAGAGAGIALHNTSLYVPSASNSGIINLGSSGRKWNQLYASNGTISTSDRNVKTDIASMSDTQEKLFNELKPVTYKFIDGTSDRTHYGFISQDVEESLDVLGLKGTDFAGFCKDMQVDEDGIEILDENGKNIYDYSLRYSEFIALNTHMIQKLQAEIAELKATIAELKSTAQN